MKTGELAKEVVEAPDWLMEWADSVGTDQASGWPNLPAGKSSPAAPDRFLLSQALLCPAARPGPERS